MKYCPYCGSGLKDNMMFCPKCGKAFEDVTENPNMVDTVIDKNVVIIEHNDILQEENTAEEHADNIEPNLEESIEYDSAKTIGYRKKKRKFLIACVLCVAAVAISFASGKKIELLTMVAILRLVIW